MSLFTGSYRYADDVVLFVTLNLVQGLSCQTTGGCGGEMDPGAAGVQSTNKFRVTVGGDLTSAAISTIASA